MLDKWLDTLERSLDSVTEGMECIADVISTTLLISGSIVVGELSVKTIQAELCNRKELKYCGVTQVLIQEFIAQSSYTVVTLAALNAKRKQVGTVMMQAKKVSALKEKQLIKIW